MEQVTCSRYHSKNFPCIIPWNLGSIFDIDPIIIPLSHIRETEAEWFSEVAKVIHSFVCL